jgi:hypothetical protein
VRSIDGKLFDSFLYVEEIRKGKLLPKQEIKKYLQSKESKEDRKLHKVKVRDARGIPGGKINPFDTHVHEGPPIKPDESAKK